MKILSCRLLSVKGFSIFKASCEYSTSSLLELFCLCMFIQPSSMIKHPKFNMSKMVFIFPSKLLLCVCALRVRLFVTPWTVACRTLLSTGFSRQQYWSGLLFSSPGDLSDPGIGPPFLNLLHWQAGSFSSVPPLAIGKGNCH